MKKIKYKITERNRITKTTYYFGIAFKKEYLSEEFPKRKDAEELLEIIKLVKP